MDIPGTSELSVAARKSLPGTGAEAIHTSMPEIHASNVEKRSLKSRYERLLAEDFAIPGEALSSARTPPG